MTGLERDETQTLLQGSPQPLDEGDGAGPANGTEALANGKGLAPLAKHGRGELRPLVGDEVFGSAVAGGVAWAKRSAMSSAEGSRVKTRKARGKREKASKTTASLSEKMRKRDGTSVRSAIQTWFG